MYVGPTEGGTAGTLVHAGSGPLGKRRYLIERLRGDFAVGGLSALGGLEAAGPNGRLAGYHTGHIASLASLPGP